MSKTWTIKGHSMYKIIIYQILEEHFYFNRNSQVVASSSTSIQVPSSVRAIQSGAILFLDRSRDHSQVAQHSKLY
ncbi:hypothetical protein FGO68_gene5544 [Halteria grandinella]|uniref:Uncharacterized protein n=1 Tax=Halteria grandinella TaxID=5974 RepID=A0A8J8NHV7_HALGN|nr:hypothetical protein FGO68_gene5544 [Halteria grandinella]